MNEQHARDQPPHLAAVGFDVADVAAAVARAGELMAPKVHRRTYASELPLEAVAAPDATEIFLCAVPDHAEPPWVAEFEGGDEAIDGLFTSVDHVNRAEPWQDFDEAVLFYTSMFGLEAMQTTEIAGPRGLVRSQVMQTPDGRIRLPLNVAPALSDAHLPQHIAIGTTDVVAVAQAARDRGLRFLPIPANYHDDLTARFALADAVVDQLRSLNLLDDLDGDGEFLPFFTRTVGEIFLEVVVRRGGYPGHGAANAPIRLAAQRGL